MRRSFEVGETVGSTTVVRSAGPKTQSHVVVCAYGHETTTRNYNILRAKQNGWSVGCALCEDLTGVRFGRLEVIGRNGKSKDGKYLWLARCQCGRTTVVSGVKLRGGFTQSCGIVGCRIGTSHGMSKKSRSYNIWKSMMARCTNPRHENFHRYGAIGISVAKRWMRFEGFFADMGEAPGGMVLDRLDNTKGYSHNNCRWATYKQSTQNRRNTVWIAGLRVEEFAKLYNMPPARVRSRLRAGWTLEQIRSHPECVPDGYNVDGKPVGGMRRHVVRSKGEFEAVAAGVDQEGLEP